MSGQKAKKLKGALTDKRLVRETHALLWREPFMNEGQRDEGWMCREHALITAGVGALLGYKPAVAWGSLALIGQVADGSSALLYVGEHSWCMFDGAGFFDLSLDLSPGKGPGWGVWPGHLLAGDGFYPGKKIEFRCFSADQSQRFSAAIESAKQKATAERGLFSAYYHGEEVAWLAADYIADAPSFINSPLTDELKELPSFTPEIYAKAIKHCWNVLNHRTRSLAELPQREAWKIISESEHGALEWLVSNAALPSKASAADS